MGHVLRQIGQQYRHVKADFTGWLLETVGELLTVDHLILICLRARKQELDFWTSELLLAVHGLEVGRGWGGQVGGQRDGLGSLMLFLKQLWTFHKDRKVQNHITSTQG